MAAESSKKSGKMVKPSGNSQEEIVAGFNELRQQQRALASKLSELEIENKEHELVIKTLDDTDPERKCFRMVGGVLVERTVKEVLPALKNNSEQISKIVEGLEKSLTEKGKAINEYREKHNIRVQGEDEKSTGNAGQGDEGSKPSNQGVLVSGGAS